MIDTFDVEGKTFNMWATCWPADGFDVGALPWTDEDAEPFGAYGSWLAYLVDGVGWGYAIDPDGDAERFLLENGIAPGQSFCVRLGNYCGQMVGHEAPEWQDEWSVEVVVAIEPWPVERVAAAWEAWLSGNTEAHL